MQRVGSEATRSYIILVEPELESESQLRLRRLGLQTAFVQHVLIQISRQCQLIG
jgi:hypothetical protein